MSVVSGLLDKYGIKASLAQADDFEKWLIERNWNLYNEDKMNNRVVIENEIKKLGIRFANGTVKKDYNAQIEVPFDLVCDMWIEGLEQTGLDWTVEDITKCENKAESCAGTLQENGINSDNEQQDNPEVICFCEDKNEKENPKGDKCILKIFGKPIKSGDFTIKLCYKHYGWIEGEPISYINIPIAFNPDPRSLWRNIPTPKKSLFYKPDAECEYIKVEESEATGPRKDVVAASQRGRSHAQDGKARDDHFRIFHCDESDWYILAVADGAGSAKYSRQGSRIACDTVVEYCINKLKDSTKLEDAIRAYRTADDEETSRKQMANVIYSIVGNAAFSAHKTIIDQAKQTANDIPGVTVKDFATTLMFSICKKFDFGWFVASYWVGDGAMCIFNNEKGTFKLLGIPDEGEFSGQTRFLTMPEVFIDGKAIMDRLRFSIEEDFTALFLMTDGISDPMFETENNLNNINKWAEFWDKLKTGFPDDEISGVDLKDDNEESKDQLLKWMDFWSPGNHDDRTLVILY